MSVEGFSDRLKVLIGDRSNSKFARLCEIPESSVRKYLSGSVPGMDILVKIAEANSSSIEWLATGRGVPFPPERMIDIPPDVAQRLDMKEQYVRAIFYRLHEIQATIEPPLHVDAEWFALSMLNQLLIEKFGGREASDEELDQVLSEYVDKLVRQARGK